MSWFSTNFDLLIRTCFALEPESESSDPKSSDAKENGRPQLNPLNSSTLKKDETDCGKPPLALPSPSEKTESVLSFSTFTGSGNSIDVKKKNEPLPSYLDASTCRKRRHRRETSQHDVLVREGYEIHGILSSGRFGSALLAKCKNSPDSPGSASSEHKVVTLNTYHKSVLSETYQQHIPHREKELLQSFDHPFISTVLGSFSDRNCLYLISPMEMGGPLSHLLQNSLSYGITDKMKTFYAACVLSVLKYAHGQNIVHRGLHPDSLLIDSKGYLKVTDWGFAKVVTDRTYTLCGHVEYLCPEAVGHDSGYGKGADYWAFGVLIYEMLVGRSAFAPSSLDFKYDAKYDVIGTGGSSTSSGQGVKTSSSNNNCSSKSAIMDGGVSAVDRTGSPSPTNRGGQLNHFSSQQNMIQPTASTFTGDTLDHTLADPSSHDTGTIVNILTREPIYPSYMPHPSKSIVQGLCQKNMTQRLGTRRGGKGIEDIQKHIFFQDVEWSRLYKKLVQAPWVPTSSTSAKENSLNSATCDDTAKYYPNYLRKQHIKDVELYGPTFCGYNCPDWNSFV